MREKVAFNLGKWGILVKNVQTNTFVSEPLREFWTLNLPGFTPETLRFIRNNVEEAFDEIYPNIPEPRPTREDMAGQARIVKEVMEAELESRGCDKDEATLERRSFVMVPVTSHDESPSPASRKANELTEEQKARVREVWENADTNTYSALNDLECQFDVKHGVINHYLRTLVKPSDFYFEAFERADGGDWCSEECGAIIISKKTWDGEGGWDDPFYGLAWQFLPEWMVEEMESTFGARDKTKQEVIDALKELGFVENNLGAEEAL